MTGPLNLRRQGLLAALGTLPSRWYEYGIIEYVYATEAERDDFSRMVFQLGHKHLGASGPQGDPTASKMLSSHAWSHLPDTQVLHQSSDASGEWKAWDNSISFWAIPPAPSWEERLSWADWIAGNGHDMSYVTSAFQRGYDLVHGY